MSVDIDDLRRLYARFESIEKVAERVPISQGTVHRRLRDAGVNFTSTIPGKRIKLPEREVVERYVGGRSENSLATEYGVSRTVIKRILSEHGVDRRGNAEANRRMMAERTTEENKRNTAAANGAMRAKPQSHWDRIGRESALTKQRTLSKVGEGEWRVAAALASVGITPILQKAVGEYNVDIAAGSVAVEVHNSAAHPHTTARERIVDLLDLGWFVLYVKICYTGLKPAALDKVISFAKLAARHPSARRQYRMVRGDGQLIAVGQLDPVNEALVGRSVSGSDV